MIRNRGESLDDRPNLETNNSALELKCTDSAPAVSSTIDVIKRLGTDHQCLPHSAASLPVPTYPQHQGSRP